MSSNRGSTPAGGEPTFRRADRVASQQLDDEAVLLHLESGTYFTLNETGTLVWRRIEQPRSIAELLQAMLEAFEVDETTARRDLDELLAELVERGLVVRSEGA